MSFKIRVTHYGGFLTTKLKNMANKLWYRTNFLTEEQEVQISPTEDFNGIIVQTKEIDGSGRSDLYLNKDEMELLIIKMKEMMDYVKQQS
jgi:hypothetical protein